MRTGYIRALEAADASDLEVLSDHLVTLAVVSIREAVVIGRDALAGKLNRPCDNGGRCVGTTYLPPLER